MITIPRFNFPDNDPFDTSTNVDKFDKTGLPTGESVAELESTATTLFQLKGRDAIAAGLAAARRPGRTHRPHHRG